MMNRSIFYMCNDIKAKQLYVKLIKEKYIVVCISGDLDIPNVIETRVSKLLPDDLPRLVILIFGNKSVISISLQSEIIHRIDTKEPGKMVICCEDEVQLNVQTWDRFMVTRDIERVIELLKKII